MSYICDKCIYIWVLKQIKPGYKCNAVNCECLKCKVTAFVHLYSEEKNLFSWWKQLNKLEKEDSSSNEA